jgi:glycosyltransferase involved in cell wall biosynthesis
VKLACVVHRFGADLAGGSEGHCRLVAEHLADRHDVTVVTTTAHDHVTWANHYPAGESQVGRVRVLRFPVERPRDLHRFRDISDRVFAHGATPEEQDQWFRENGPQSPALLEFLAQRGAGFDLILFWSYRYYDTYFGLPLARDRAVLVPTAEEDPLIHVDTLGRLFAMPRGYLFLTPEEEALVGDRVPAALPREVIGCGIDPPAPVAPGAEAGRARLNALGLTDPYVLYLGRVDPNKGCATMLRHFLSYVASPERQAGVANLVLAGPANMPVPEHPRIRALGFVDTATRDALLADAAVLIMPSPYESLSMVLLEAWNQRVPALVNARCAVLKGQVLRADGGLYYQTSMEFGAALDFLLGHPEIARRLGAQGRDYVEREYRWPAVMSKIERVLQAVKMNAKDATDAKEERTGPPSHRAH